MAPDRGEVAFAAAAQEGREVQAEDGVETRAVGVGLVQRCGNDRRAAGFDAGAVAAQGGGGHLRRAVDGDDVAAAEALADQ
ncbi:MAG TPA: hypothetical protein VFY45_12465 [Baekduia sp.]|nr:hypothetical protein [Baekduia sp.]